MLIFFEGLMLFLQDFPVKINLILKVTLTSKRRHMLGAEERENCEINNFRHTLKFKSKKKNPNEISKVKSAEKK